MPEEIANRLTADLILCGYDAGCDGDARELRDTIKQGEITVTITDIKKLAKLRDMLEKLIENIYAVGDVAILTLFLMAVELQGNVQDAIDEINNELHLERISS